MDDEQRYTAALSKDARFDGVFFVAVRTTGIYCRPSCPAITPKRVNIVFYPTAAAAQQAGFRACKRCRPDASPGSPEWNVRSDVAGRAMRLIADGVVDRSGVDGLAARLGYSARQVGRLLTAEVGAAPLALARAQRARTARVLIETTNLPMGDIAFAAGFASIRQFNATILEVYDIAPRALRERAAARDRAGRSGRRPALLGAGGGHGAADDHGAAGVLRLRLPFRPPIDLGRVFGFLAARAIPGVELAAASWYARTISLPNGSGMLSLRLVPGSSWVDCSLALSDLRDVTAAVQRCRRLLDLDADPAAISGFFAGDAVIGPLAAGCPGRRAVGTVDGNEIAIRAVLGQQVSVAAARRLGARLVALCGTPLPASAVVAGLHGVAGLDGHPGPAAGTPGLNGASTDGAGLTHVFPDAASIAALDPAVLPMPLSRARAVVTLAAALSSGDISLDPGADRDEVSARLLALPGIGPWTAGYIRMRALSDPDVFLPEDVGVLRALARLAGDTPGTPAAALALAEGWRPWRSYAVHHLWATLEPPPPEPAPSRPGSRGTASRAGGGRASRPPARTRAAFGYPNEVRDDVMTSPFLAAGPVAPTWYDIVDSPVGRILLTGDERALGGLYLLDAGEHSASVRPEWTRRPGGFAGVAEQLAEYFAGSRKEFEVPLAPRGTPFQLAVWAELIKIPYGSTTSYGAVAAGLGKSPVASRAVGLANGRNPVSIIIPCHRVIGADGSLTGYGWGVDRKEWLLRHEGASAVVRADLQPTLFG
jgi:AraC family transcriptional regulator of adaptative response / DNA-3-methyladenine glycosylase II